jgi:hypothetical protein
MLIRLNNTRWLTRDFTTPEEERSSALRVVFSGNRHVQVAELLGAGSALLLDRGNRTVRLEFTVEELHASAAEAQATVLTALEGTLEGLAEVFCGDEREGYRLVRMEGAVLSALEESGSRGVRSRVRYRLEAAGAVLAEGEEALGSLDAGRYGIAAGFGGPEAGTLDGGAYADALLPGLLALDHGAYAGV